MAGTHGPPQGDKPPGMGLTMAGSWWTGLLPGNFSLVNSGGERPIEVQALAGRETLDEAEILAATGPERTPAPDVAPEIGAKARGVESGRDDGELRGEADGT